MLFLTHVHYLNVRVHPLQISLSLSLTHTSTIKNHCSSPGMHRLIRWNSWDAKKPVVAIALLSLLSDNQATIGAFSISNSNSISLPPKPWGTDPGPDENPYELNLYYYISKSTLTWVVVEWYSTEEKSWVDRIKGRKKGSKEEWKKEKKEARQWLTALCLSLISTSVRSIFHAENSWLTDLNVFLLFKRSVVINKEWRKA